MLQKCAPLYQEGACRQAHERFTEIPVFNRIHTLTRACAEAYCPHLSAPKPRLCDAASGATESVTKTAQAWRELDEQILHHDLGPRAQPVLEARQRASARALGALQAYFDAGSPPYAPETESFGATQAIRSTRAIDSSAQSDSGLPAPANLALVVTSSGATFKGSMGELAPGCEQAGTGPTFATKRGADGQPVFDYVSMTACARRLKQEFPSETTIRIVADASIPYRIVIGCMDAVRKDDQGDLFPEITFAVSSGQ